MKKICCIFNYAPLYRKSIFTKIDECFDAQFYFGDFETNIEKFDCNVFKKPVKKIGIHNLFGKFPWWSGLIKASFEDCEAFLMTGDFAFSFFPFLMLCHIQGKKVYGWGHGSKTFDGRYRIFKLLYKLWDGFYTYGDNGRARLIELGIPAKKLHTIYNSLNGGVDIDANSKLKTSIYSEHFGNNNPVLLFVGRLTKIKQLDWILEAAKYHREKGINYNVIIIGDGDCRKQLEEYSNANNLNNIIWFYGKCYDESLLNTLIYNADLCVSPGNVGLTALHSMTYGTPVISHDDFETQMPEYETIIRGITGDLYTHGSFNDFCNVIEKWLINNTDKESVRVACYNVINSRFNSNYQIELLKETLSK